MVISQSWLWLSLSILSHYNHDLEGKQNTIEKSIFLSRGPFFLYTLLKPNYGCGIVVHFHIVFIVGTFDAYISFLPWHIGGTIWLSSSQRNTNGSITTYRPGHQTFMQCLLCSFTLFLSPFTLFLSPPQPAHLPHPSSHGFNSTS